MLVSNDDFMYWAVPNLSLYYPGPANFGSLFTAVKRDLDFFSHSLDLICRTWVQLKQLRPLVAPVSSSAPCWGDCLTTLDPRINYFQSSWDLYHHHAGACGTAAPLGCRLALVPCEKRLLLWTWAMIKQQKSKQIHQTGFVLAN